MGFRVQLIAVSGKEPRTIQRDYGAVPTRQREEIPESPVVGAVLPNGAYLLYINDKDKDRTGRSGVHPPSQRVTNCLLCQRNRDV